MHFILIYVFFLTQIPEIVVVYSEVNLISDVVQSSSMMVHNIGWQPEIDHSILTVLQKHDFSFIFPYFDHLFECW